MVKKIKTKPIEVITKSSQQIGKSIKNIDKKWVALPPGKRISKYGKVYYERRKNRSDLRDNI